MVEAALGFKDTPCLGVGSYSPSERRNVTVRGVSQPLIVGGSDWGSAMVEAWVYRIIAEEALGIETAEGPSGAHSMETYDNAGFCKAHVVLDTWQLSVFDDHVREFNKQHPDLTPIFAGDLGYEGYDAFFVREVSLEPAMRDLYLPLHVYTSYSHPQFQPQRYFDDHRRISSGMLQTCEFLEGALGQFDDRNVCGEGHWWISPTCRANSSACVPVITGGSGWAALELMQRATSWSIPAALSVANTWQNYLDIPRDFRVIFYWWGPDTSFATLPSTRIIWPTHNERETAQGNYRTDSRGTKVWKWACNHMADKTNVGTVELLAVLRNMRFLLQDMQETLEAMSQFEDGNISRHEAVACQWLRANDAWQDWIPLTTACVERQGLVDGNSSFVDARTAARACLSCSPGRMSDPVRDVQGRSYRCKECPAGKFQDSFASTTCKLCPEGRAAAGQGMSSCERCPFGAYATDKGQNQCDDCPAGFVTSFMGATSSAACICPEGFFHPRREVEECQQCPPGMKCPQGSDVLAFGAVAAGGHSQFSAPTLKPGFWSSAEEPFLAFRCESDIRCPGGRLPGNACAARLENQGCAHCEDGFYWDGAACYSCADNTLQTVILPMVLIVAIPIIVCVLYWLSIDEYNEWNLWYHGIGSSFFILLNHYQVTNVIRQTNLAYPEPVAGKFEWFAFISDVIRLFRPDCNGMKSFRFHLLMQSFCPVFAFLAYLVIWGISQLVGLRFPMVRMGINRTIDGFLSIMFTFFGGIADSAFTIFKCGSNPSGLYTLLKDRSITCYDGEWQGMLILGIFAVLFWCVGFAAVMARAMYIAPRCFHEDAMQQRWRFLFIRYRADVHWWALVFIAKGVFVNMGALITSSGFGQVCWILGVLLIYTYLTAIFRPWRHRLNSSVDLWVHLCLFVVCTMTAWFAREASLDPEQGDELGNFLLMAVLCFVASPVLVTSAIMLYEGIDKAKRKRQQHIKDIMKSIRCLSKASSDDAQTFLWELSEVDFDLMLKTRCLIQTEIAHEKCRWGYSTHALRASLQYRRTLAGRSTSMTFPNDCGSSSWDSADLRSSDIPGDFTIMNNASVKQVVL